MPVGEGVSVLVALSMPMRVLVGALWSQSLTSEKGSQDAQHLLVTLRASLHSILTYLTPPFLASTCAVRVSMSATMLISIPAAEWRRRYTGRIAPGWQRWTR